MEIYTWPNLMNVIFPGALLQISSCFPMKGKYVGIQI